MLMKSLSLFKNESTHVQGNAKALWFKILESLKTISAEFGATTVILSRVVGEPVTEGDSRMITTWLKIQNGERAFYSIGEKKLKDNFCRVRYDDSDFVASERKASDIG